MVADITDLSELPKDYFEEIVAQDCLEHILRVRTLEVLKNWNRLLKTNGLLWLRVPSVVDLAELIKNTKDVSEQELLIQCMFGTQAYDGDFHYTGFTRELLECYLSKSGYRIAEMSLRDSWIFEVSAIKVKDPEAATED